MELLLGESRLRQARAEVLVLVLALVSEEGWLPAATAVGGEAPRGNGRGIVGGRGGSKLGVVCSVRRPALPFPTG